MNIEKSIELFNKAKELIPGGVNSPVRAFGSVGLNPLFIKEAKGSEIIDEDGNRYIDFVNSWGPLILGHAHKNVTEAVINAAQNGSSFGAPTWREIELAKILCEAVPSLEMVRLVNSGTEAVMSAIRLARGYTGRDKIVKFEGCYHGHSDGLLVKAGSGALTTGVPDSAGIPENYAENTIVSQYNHCDELESLFKTHGGKIAAVIVEPVAANMGVVLPNIEFLRLLRQLTQQYGALLIFDEVITGFRVSYEGAQGYYGIIPDLTILGKIIGGGLPIGAYGGKREIMKMVSPTGPVYQAGTLSGNPIATAAGIETLKILKEDKEFYKRLDSMGAILQTSITASAARHTIPISINRIGSLISIFFSEYKITDYKTAISSDTKLFLKYFGEILKKGIYIAPSQFEAMFLSAAHSNKDIEKTIKAIDETFLYLSENMEQF